MPVPVCDNLRLQDDSITLKQLYVLEQTVAAKVSVQAPRKHLASGGRDIYCNNLFTISKYYYSNK